MRFRGLIICCLYSNISTAQNPSTFKPLRYDEDYRVYQQDSTLSWYRKAKYTAFDSLGKTYLGLGGDMRLQYFYYKNEGWGDEPQDNDGYVLSRWLLHSDLHIGKRFRTFIQIQSSLANSRLQTNPVEENPVDLHQAFVDVQFKIASSDIVLRTGRQEFLYGAQRLVSVREGPNSRQAFDAIRTILNMPVCKADLFYSYHVRNRKGIFDDAFSKQQAFWGAYIAWPNIKIFKNIDVYYLGLRKTQSIFDDGIGSELRHSIGMRIWNGKHDWQYDVEGVYQFGNFAGTSIKAWTASINTSYIWNRLHCKPLIGLKTEIISGNKQYGDGRLQTFNPLYPRGAYFGLAALIGPLNLVDVHPYASLNLSNSIVLDVDYDLFWRKRDTDGIYTVNSSLIYSGRQISAKTIGRQLATSISYNQRSGFIQMSIEFTWFDAGQFLKQAGSGKDILFTGITTQLRF